MQELTVQSIDNKIELMVQDKKERDDFSQRLALACDKAGIPAYGRQATIAVRMKLTPKAVGKWFNGESVPRKDKLNKLADILGTTSAYLAGYADDDGIIKDHMKNGQDIYRIEVLDLVVSAGPGRYMLSEAVEVLNAIEFTSDRARALFGSRSADDVKVMTVDGDSMYPTIKSGDRLFFDVSVREFTTDGVYAFVYGKTFHVKRLQMQGTKLIVLSDNPNLERWEILEDTEDQFYVMGKALLHESIMYGKL